MDFFEAVEQRHSIRIYQRRDVEEDRLQRILACANAAPSAGNLQAYEIVVIKAEKNKQALARAAYNQAQLSIGPLVLAFVQNPERSRDRYKQRGVALYSLQDATIACAYAQLAATALGLASCWVGAFDENDVRAALNAPADLIPVALLSIGYAKEEPFIKGRRDLTELVKWETF